MQMLRDIQDGIIPGFREQPVEARVGQSRFIGQLEGYSTMGNPGNRAKLLGATGDLLATLAKSASGKNFLQAGIDALIELVQVQYGAISMLDESGNLTRFVHAGITAGEAQQIIHRPSGSGLLGKIVRENFALRMDNVADDPGRAGFP